MDTVIALIPIKAHSERVPNKNSRMFGGKPLYHHIVETLENLEQVSCIVINTDNDMLAAEAEKKFLKVRINERPVRLRGDFVPTNDIFAYDIETVEGEHFLQTHCTNPLLSLPTIEKAIQQYFDSLNHYDSLFSVTEYKSRFYSEAGDPINHDPKELVRTQDLPPLYDENSNFYLFSRSSFKAAGNNRIGLKPQMFVMERLEAVDIDEPEDWELAETLFKIKQGSRV